MAKYVGLLTADARGKLGGAIFSRSSSGTTMRQHLAPTQRNSPLQVKRRITFTAAAPQWQALAPASKLAWAALAVTTIWTNLLGQAYSPSAQQLFTFCQTNLALAGLPPKLTAAPSVPLLTAILGLTAHFVSGSDMSVEPSIASTPGDFYLVIYAASPTQNRLTSYRLNLFRYILATVANNDPVPIAAQYQSAFNMPGQAGFVVYARILDAATGYMGAAFYSALNGG